ncbi:hypothetical protein ACFLZY_00060 [Patescibacteria group bacterium]
MMNRQKFVKMVAEFSFLNGIFTDQGLSADSVGSIVVMRADRNLLEVSPSVWAHDMGEWGDHEGSRNFWYVIPGEVGQFKSSWCRLIASHGTIAEETVPYIGSQLLTLDKDVLFIVEIHEERWHCEDETPNVVVYKMKGFDWRRYARRT